MDLCLPKDYRFYSNYIGFIGLSANVLLALLIVKSKTPIEMRFFNCALLYRSAIEATEVVITWTLEPVGIEIGRLPAETSC